MAFCFSLFSFHLFLSLNSLVTNLMGHEIRSHISVVVWQVDLELIFVEIYLVGIILVVDCKQEQTSDDAVIEYYRSGCNLLP